MKKEYIKTIKSYDNTAMDYDRKTMEIDMSEFIERFCSLLSGRKVLDLGCGPGRDMASFISKGFDVTGLDASKGMLKLAEKNINGKAKLVQGNFLGLPFGSSEFDGIWCNASLIHLSKDDLPKALGEVFRVLKSRGIFYASVKEGKEEGIVNDGRYGGQEKFFAYFSVKEFENFLKDAGFNVLAIETRLSEQQKEYDKTPRIIAFCRKP